MPKYRRVVVKSEKTQGTVVLRDKKTGHLKGRRDTKAGEKSDLTRTLRVESPPDISGEIYGRTTPVKGNAKNRAYTKQINSLR